MGEAVSVSLGVAVMEGVLVTLGVHEGVNVGVKEGVNEEVSVIEAVNVAGTNGVRLSVLVRVVVGVGVNVGVLVTVLVKTVAVGLRVGEGGVTVSVKEAVAEGVKSDGSGASPIARKPRQ